MEANLTPRPTLFQPQIILTASTRRVGPPAELVKPLVEAFLNRPRCLLLVAAIGIRFRPDVFPVPSPFVDLASSRRVMTQCHKPIEIEGIQYLLDEI